MQRLCLPCMLPLYHGQKQLLYTKRCVTGSTPWLKPHSLLSLALLTSAICNAVIARLTHNVDAIRLALGLHARLEAHRDREVVRLKFADRRAAHLEPARGVPLYTLYSSLPGVCPFILYTLYSSLPGVWG